MLKAILALVGFNFLMEHPYIAFAVVCVVGYGVYCHFQSKNVEQTDATPQETSDAPSSTAISDSEYASPEVTDLLNTLLIEDKKLADFTPDQREAIVNFHVMMLQKILDKTITEREYNAFSAMRPSILKKIDEFDCYADIDKMTPQERQRIFNALDNLLEDEKNHGLNREKINVVVANAPL